MANIPGAANHGPRRTGGTRFRSSGDAPRPERPARAAQGRNPYARPAHGHRPAQVRACAPSPYARPARAQRKTASPVPVVLGIVAAVAVVAVVVLFAFPLLFGSLGQGSGVEPGQKVELTVPAGASGDTIASLLSENHVIEDPSAYYAAVKKLGAESSLKPGDYRFETGQDPVSVVKQLVSGPNVEGVKLTVPEGRTVAQVAALVEDAYGISADEFVATAKASAYVEDYPFLQDAANDSLEGFLFPKTYTFSGTPTADGIIRAMLDQYEADVLDVLDFEGGRAAVASRYGVEMSDYDILILASIIEREAITHDQRYNVASTFYNRLHDDMALQSDATMMYVTGGEVTAEDLKTESPYNTYLNRGLTPTPICAPSLDSIEAALKPADTDYLYFFITQDNEYFSATYDDHLQAIEENR